MTVPEGIEALWVRVTPPSHLHHTASSIYCMVYHPPCSPTRPTLIDHIIDTCDMLKPRFPSTKLVICGDFNELNTSEIQEQIHLLQIIDFPIHGPNTFNMILTDLGGQHLPLQLLPPVGHSTHVSILWNPAPTTLHQQAQTLKEY